MATLEKIEFVNKGAADFDVKKQPVSADNLNQLQNNVENAINDVESSINNKNYVWFAEEEEWEE